MFAAVKTVQLAQTDIQPGLVSQAIFYCLLLLGLALVGLVLTHFIRRWAKQTDTPPTAGFTFEDLRRLHREGKISDAEFKLTSGKIAGATKAQYLNGGGNKPTARKRDANG